ncbi:MAG: STAS domain-containing protein [Phycisphaerales bacterium JB039]
MAEEMQVGREQRDDAVILSPEGDVDLSASPSLRLRLREALEQRPARLVVNLGGVDYMDSSGVATLVEGLQIARRASTTLVLANLRDRVRSVFEIARLDTVFTIVGTVDEAMEC